MNTLDNDSNNATLYDEGCRIVALTRISNREGSIIYTPGEVNDIASEKGLYDDGGELSSENAATLLSILTGKDVTVEKVTGDDSDIARAIYDYYNLASQVYVIAKLNEPGFTHFVNINGVDWITPIVADTSTKNRNWNDQEDATAVEAFSFTDKKISTSVKVLDSSKEQISEY